MKDENFLKDFIEKVEQNNQFKYLYFWGHTAKKADVIDKSCLSQWFPAAFQQDGIEYLTAEHYMMAQKAKLFNDLDIFQEIIQAQTPNEAKKLGRMVRGYTETLWLRRRFKIVVEGNIAKFSQHHELKKFLQSTHNDILVEASPLDSIWGIGMAEDHLDIENLKQWKGLNLLGFALMEVRKSLKITDYQQD